MGGQPHTGPEHRPEAKKEALLDLRLPTEAGASRGHRWIGAALPTSGTAPCLPESNIPIMEFLS